MLKKCHLLLGIAPHDPRMAGATALLCVDMQRDFCVPDAVLCVKGAMACLDRVIEAVDIARGNKIPVIWVIREHHPSGKALGAVLL